MDNAEALAQVRALRFKFADVDTLKGGWEADRTYCVAPKDVISPLHLMVKAALGSRDHEDALYYLKKIDDILEWVWPSNTRQRFDVYKLGDDLVQIPAKR